MAKFRKTIPNFWTIRLNVRLIDFEKSLSYTGAPANDSSGFGNFGSQQKLCFCQKILATAALKLTMTIHPESFLNP